MFAKAEWFERRKYGGWGVTPKCWQGWVYILAVLLSFVIIQAIPVLDLEFRLFLTLAWVIFLMIDIIPVMITLKKDEREHKNEALAERNAAWFMSTVLVLGVLYEIIISVLDHEILLNWFMVVALIGGVIVKSLSNYALDKRGV